MHLQSYLHTSRSNELIPNRRNWVAPPPPPTPDQNIYNARTHFRQKGVFFSMGGNSRNQEKGVILQAWVREISKKVDI